MKTNASIAVFAISSLLLISLFAIASAQGGGPFANGQRQIMTQTQQQLVSSAMQQVGCKTNFTVGLINEITTEIPNTSSALNPVSASLKQYTFTLQGYASSGNITAFRSYLQGTYDPYMGTLQFLISAAARASITPNTVSQSELQAIRSYYNSSKSQAQACIQGSSKSYAQAKINGFEQALAQAQGMADNFSTKAQINVSSMTQVIQNANSTIVQPLQNAVNSASTPQQIQAALQQYCLFNGCPSGTNYHFDAKFGIQSLTLVYNKMQVSNFSSSTLSAIDSHINNASTVLSQTGTSQYSDGENTTIWQNMQAAQSLIKAALQAKASSGNTVG